MKLHHKEALLGASVVGLALLGMFVVIPAGITLPDGLESRALAPNFWPLIIMGMLGLSGAIVFFQALSLGKKTSVFSEPPSSQDSEKDRPPLQMLVRVGLVFFVLFALYFMMSLVGIVLVSMVAFAFLTWFAGETRWKVIVPISILLPVLLYYFFVHVAQIPMPLGMFETG